MGGMFRRAGAGGIAFALALALPLLGVAGCGRGGTSARGPAPAPATHVVALRKVAFDPAIVRAAPGDTIVWRNDDLVPHTVTARDGRWGSGNLAPDSTFRWVVAGRDSAPYFCTYH